MLEGLLEEMARADQNARNAEAKRYQTMLDMAANTVPLKRTFEALMEHSVLSRLTNRRWNGSAD